MSRGVGIVAMALLPALAFAEMTPIPPARQTYLLSCGGCHGLDGVSNAQLVPDLKDQVGFFFNLPEGRRYLARLPNVAFSTNSDQELAALLNYAVFTLGGASVPKGAKPYTAREVGQLRQQPLTETALFQYRQRMVETLIADYQAPVSLRRYGEDIYGRKNQ